MADEEHVNLFSGAGGTSVGLRRAGIDALGIDWWDRACETHEKNGHRTLRADLATIDWAPWVGRVRLMWASPPCQPWSAAGDQEGEFDDRDGIPWWLRAVKEVRPRVIVMENVKGLTFKKHHAYLAGMVASVRALGYDVQWKLLDAADYGVPQNRERFILLGRCDGGRIVWPTVSHTEGGGLFTKPWVSMAEALGWGYDDRAARAICGDRTPRWLYEDRDGTHGVVLRSDQLSERSTGREETVRGLDEPATTIDAKLRAAWAVRTGVNSRRRQAAEGETWRDWSEPYERDADRPSPTVGTAAGRSWTTTRPATTVAGDPRIFQPGGHHTPGAQSQNAIRVEIWEAAVLQGFPADYQFCGNRTEQATQVGNAVPPPLAEAIVRALLPT